MPGRGSGTGLSFQLFAPGQGVSRAGGGEGLHHHASGLVTHMFRAYDELGPQGSGPKLPN